MSASRVGTSIHGVVDKTSKTATIRTDGTFQLTALPSGAYRLCAQAKGNYWLDPCEWGAAAPTIVIPAPINPPPSIDLVLKKGAVLNIRLDDPGQLLKLHEGNTLGAHLLVGLVTDAKIFRPAAISANDSSSRTYSMIVPYDRQHIIKTTSAFFLLADQVGRLLPNFGNTISWQAPSGQVPALVVLKVVGTSPPK